MVAGNLQNQGWVLTREVGGELKEEDLQLRDLPTPTLEDGEVLVQTTFVSIDPYMRNRMGQVAKGHYSDGFTVGKPINGFITGVVKESKSEKLSVGLNVSGMGDYSRLIKGKAETFTPIDVSNFSASAYVGVLGITGLSAYFPMTEIGQVKKGETVFVSGAAGAVGQVAAQIAKIQGARVVGSAGSEEKVAFLKSLGIEAFNYKTEPVLQSLEHHFPEGIDVYWDNVGGETLDAVLLHMKTSGRIIACGAISEYQKTKEEKYGLKNYFNIIIKQLRIEGFLLWKYLHRSQEGIKQLSQWLSAGELKAEETMIDNFQVSKAFLGLFRGDNLGKMVVKV